MYFQLISSGSENLLGDGNEIKDHDFSIVVTDSLLLKYSWLIIYIYFQFYRQYPFWVLLGAEMYPHKIQMFKAKPPASQNVTYLEIEPLKR